MDTSSTAQGGGRSFKTGNPERLAVVNQKWQSEPTDGQQGCWRQLSAVVVVAIIVVICNCSWSGTSGAVQCSIVVVVVVVVVIVVVVVVKV